MRSKLFHIVILLFVLGSTASAQSLRIYGKVLSKQDRKPLPYAIVYIKETGQQGLTNEKGQYEITEVKNGQYTVLFRTVGYKEFTSTIKVDGKDEKLNVLLLPSIRALKALEVELGKEETSGLSHMRDVQGTGIYAAKKTEVVLLDDITASTATNNPRQVFSKVAGLNIWESDDAGLQLGIAARGLNPNRTSGFNTRLNGYDMSADAIGYPESYYTPPSEALERIEVVRGAASLQFGTQFGGMLNFVKKKGGDSTKAEVVSRQTLGSFGFFNSFNSVGGTIKKLNYYSYVQHKKGRGWRANSEFELNSFYTGLNYKASHRLTLSLDLTLMKYLARQPGGLTDRMYEMDPRQSIRDRNWFKVNWNLAAFVLDYKITERTHLNSKSFGLLASRDALGYLGPINRIDPMQERNLLADQYANIGNETRLLHTYKIGKQTNNYLIGLRVYKGHLDRNQGLGSAASDADFSFIPNDPERSSYMFPSKNIALFSENIFRLSDKLSITPGMRMEYILTESDGYFQRIYKDLAGNILEQEKIDEHNDRSRLFTLMGIGVGYNLSDRIEAYGNFSQNYRAMTFNDMRVTNPSLQVDPNLQDEKGHNADLGLRGRVNRWLQFDFTLYQLAYKQRIGIVQQVDSVLFRTYRLRTNVSDAQTLGLESFVEVDLLKIGKCDSVAKECNSWTVFANISALDARYIDSDEPAFYNKKVELVPNLIMKYGTSYRNKKGFSASYNFAYTSSHFTDATNAAYTANAVNGIIPSYWVMDLSLKKQLGRWQIETGCNNLTNKMYFTRRADGYPGPGIIPSSGRNFYLTLQVKI